jgi:ferredoxin-NADP reductase
MTATELAAPRLAWQTAEVRAIIDETPRVRTLALDVPDWPGHRPGQHVDIRLTGDDGYSAQRSYSLASAPEAPLLAITVERIATGEVSPYLASEVRPGDRFELRGPIGGHFVWTVESGGPLMLIAGGSGIAPLMAMLRHRAARGSTLPARLIYSSRTGDDIIYRDELARMVAARDGLEVFHVLTRSQPVGFAGETRRIDQDMLARLGFAAQERPQIYICGPSSLVETAGRSLVTLGHDRRLIRTERFGPTGP